MLGWLEWDEPKLQPVTVSREFQGAVEELWLLAHLQLPLYATFSGYAFRPIHLPRFWPSS